MSHFLRDAWRLIKGAASAWVDDYAPSMGAALAFYTLFSIAPLLLIVISVAGLVFGEEAARGQIIGTIGGLIGPDGARTIQDLIASASKPSSGIVGTLVGVVTLLIGATTVFGELRDAMDRIWRAPARESGGLWALLRTRVLSVGMVLAFGFLLMVSLVASAALEALGHWWAPWFGDLGRLLQVVNAAVSFGLLTAVFAAIYRWMPHIELGWRDVLIGAVFTAVLFVAGKTAIAWYIGSSGVASPFGAAGSLVALMFWVYASAQVFLFGAEVTWIYALRHGSLRGSPIADEAAAGGAGPAQRPRPVPHTVRDARRGGVTPAGVTPGPTS